MIYDKNSLSLPFGYQFLLSREVREVNHERKQAKLMHAAVFGELFVQGCSSTIASVDKPFFVSLVHGTPDHMRMKNPRQTYRSYIDYHGDFSLGLW